jgi:hypothetical protein
VARCAHELLRELRRAAGVKPLPEGVDDDHRLIVRLVRLGVALEIGVAVIEPKGVPDIHPQAEVKEDWFAPSELLPFIDQLVKNEVEVDGCKLQRADSGGLGERQEFPGYNPYFPYPGHLYRTNGRSELIIDCQHLLAYTLPYYSDLYEAIRDWTGITLHRGVGDLRIGGILVFLPECRARIERFLHMDEMLTVSLALAEHVVSDLRLKGAWQGDERWHSFDCAVSGPQVEIPVPTLARALDVHLIGPDDRVYEFHREDRQSWIGQERVLGSSPSKPLDLQALELGFLSVARDDSILVPVCYPSRLPPGGTLRGGRQLEPRSAPVRDLTKYCWNR